MEVLEREFFGEFRGFCCGYCRNNYLSELQEVQIPIPDDFSISHGFVCAEGSTHKTMPGKRKAKKLRQKGYLPASGS